MEKSVIHAIAAGFFFGIAGAAAGGMLGVCLGRVKDRTLSCLLNATGGLMIAVVCFELLPQAYALDAASGITGLLAGIALMMGCDALVARRMERTPGKGGMARAGVLMAVGIALHNLPEGLAVGSGYAHAPQLGMALGLMIALHDVPEGIATAVPLRASGMSGLRALMITALSGVPTGLGALAGALTGGISQGAVSLALGFAGGAMLQVTAQELLPRAGELTSDARTTLYLALGVALGSVLALHV